MPLPKKNKKSPRSRLRSGQVTFFCMYFFSLLFSSFCFLFFFYRGDLHGVVGARQTELGVADLGDSVVPWACFIRMESKFNCTEPHGFRTGPKERQVIP